MKNGEGVELEQRFLKYSWWGSVFYSVCVCKRTHFYEMAWDLKKNGFNVRANITNI